MKTEKSNAKNLVPKRDETITPMTLTIWYNATEKL